MRVVYLAGAAVATVLAIVGVFLLFSGDQPEPRPAPNSPTPTEIPDTPLARQPGKAAKVVGRVADERTGLVYPRLGKPWKARDYAPFSVAQRIGEVAVPQTVIASAMVPLDVEPPRSDADYRDIARRTAAWALRTQHPQGSTLEFIASQPAPQARGWIMGFAVSYAGGSSRGLVAVVDVGKEKPAMLLATITDKHRERWRDLNTLVKGLRTS
ncbi:hypothetical protein [Thermoactinospora rubra]|uniref:hypothetical protein n=1 Tax=Thermoactinospora rubra TaxID=1088767 RepID=UPI00117DF783|nr:hypothetical protein [Thermoactinospora rubra]